MDRTAKVFDEWATDGRDRDLERGHAHSVNAILGTAPFGEPFSFLDVGCGNGWVVRKVAANPLCTRAVGIDKSAQMIRNAQDRRVSPLEEYHAVSLEGWESEPFKVAFSMESLYYAESLPGAISRVYSLLSLGGVFLCGTDFYTENPETAGWANAMDVTMHMHSEPEWTAMFREAGFKTTSTRIRDPASQVRWKREQGTLLVTGVRPAPPG